MVERINILGKQADRIQDTGRALPRIEPSEFATGLGAEPCGERLFVDLDPISLAELGNELIKRLRSTGGRPALVDATKSCKVPLSSEDIQALEQIIEAIERTTGTRPSMGQIASVILRMYLEVIKKTLSETRIAADSNQATTFHPLPISGQKVSTKEPVTETGELNQSHDQLLLNACKNLIEEQLRPIRAELNRLAKEMRNAG